MLGSLIKTGITQEFFCFIKNYYKLCRDILMRIKSDSFLSLNLTNKENLTSVTLRRDCNVCINPTNYYLEPKMKEII